MQTGQVVVRYSSFNGRTMHDFGFSKNFALVLQYLHESDNQLK